MHNINVNFFSTFLQYTLLFIYIMYYLIIKRCYVVIHSAQPQLQSFHNTSTILT